MRRSESQNDYNPDDFICGVVEGFYGRPWTTTQRKELFKRMHDVGMNTYLYAPKDDLKHRQFWREMYSVEEAEHIRMLIAAAREHNINFIYAISPGLDICFSNQKEISCLKRKLDQVVQLGCTSFSLLFDDIDPQMCAADKEVFQSYGHAQAAVTNEIYQHLVKPYLFLFCPTEYCATRARPSVERSDYLNTIGSKLMSGVDIMWTGPRVIAKRIPPESIDELSHVLRRNPVIWDNIHANDYDQKRLFLGPYVGRSCHLLPKLRGVLTNPNCEFEANYVPIHTLAQWSRINRESIKQPTSSSMSPVRSDIKLETEDDDDKAAVGGEEGFFKKPNYGDDEGHSSSSGYCYKQALRLALLDWLKIMHQSTKVSMNRKKLRNRKSVAKALIAAAVGSLPPSCVADVCHSVVADNNLAAAVAVAVGAKQVDKSPVIGELAGDRWGTALLGKGGGVEGCASSEVANPAMAVAAVVAAVAAEEAQVHNMPIQDLSKIDPCLTLATSEIVPSLTPLETYISTAVGSLQAKNTDSSGHTPMETENEDADEGQGMQIDPQQSNQGSMNDLADGPTPSANDVHHPAVGEVSAAPDVDLEIDDDFEEEEEDPEMEVTLRDLYLLVDLFYLPYEFGKQAIRMLELFNWMRCNAHFMAHANINNYAKEAQQWRDHAIEFDSEVKRVIHLCDKLNRLPNRALIYDIFPYLTDVKGVLSTLNSYVKWLAIGEVPYLSVCYLRRLLTYCTPGYHEMFSGDDHESWMFRGGIAAEFQRMLPLEGCQDLFPLRSFAMTSDAPPDPSSADLLAPSASAAADLAGPTAPSASAMHHHYREALSTVFTVRPFQKSDRAALYEVCRQITLERAEMEGRFSASDYGDFPDTLANAMELPGDRYLASFLEHSPEYTFLVEDKEGTVCGYAMAALDRVKYLDHMYSSVLPAMRSKYCLSEPIPTMSLPIQGGQAAPVVFTMEQDGDEEESTVSRCKNVAQRLLHGFTSPMPTPALPSPALTIPPPLPPPSVSGIPPPSPSVASSPDTSSLSIAPASTYPSAFYFDILTREHALSNPMFQDDITRRLLACSFAALRTNGSQGVWCHIDVQDTSLVKMYKRFGFQEISPPDDHFVYLGRFI